MSSGKGGPNKGGNPWNQGKSFAQVVRDSPGPARNPPAAQTAVQSTGPPQNIVDEEGFTVVQSNRRNRNQGHQGHTGGPPHNPAGRGQEGGAPFSGDGQRNEGGRGRGRRGGDTGSRGDSQSRGRGRGRGRGSDDQRMNTPHSNPSNRPFEEQEGYTSQGNAGQRDQRGSQARQAQKVSDPPKLYREVNTEATHNPSQEVAALENKIIEKNRNKGLTQQFGNLKLTPNKQALPMRPGYANHGRSVDLFANYFEISGIDTLVLYEFIVYFEESLSLRVKRRLFTLLLKQPPLCDEAVATNYVDKLICTKKLDPQCINVNYYEENESASQVHTVTLQYSRTYRMIDLLADLQSPFESYHRDEKNMAIQALNMAVARFPNFSKRIQFVGQSRHFFLDVKEDLTLGGGLEARRGFFHSVKSSTGRLLLNLNVSTAAFYRSGNLRHVAEEVVQLDIATKDAAETGKLERFLKKVRIRTKHGKTPQIRTIFEVAKTNTGVAALPSQVTFWWEQGQPARHITVEEYFRKQYNLNLIQKQIVVNVGSREKLCYLPAEFCSIVEGQAARQKLHQEQTSRMIKVACRLPTPNADDISSKGLDLMGVKQQGGPKEKFGIDIADKLLSVKGIVLRPPRLKYQSDQGPYPGNGAWNFTGNLFKRAGVLPGNQCVGFLIVGGLKSDPHTFMERLGVALRQYGINWRDQQAREILIEGKYNRERGHFKAAFHKFQEAKIPFVVAILPKRDQQWYSWVKCLGDLATGIPTICVVEKPLKEGGIGLKDDDGTLRNIALKVNLKLGGINHEIESHSSIQKIMRLTMFVGIDVTHPTGTETQSGAPSISAVVANSDPTLSQWPASITTQGHRKEMVDEYLFSMMIERLSAWKNQRALPLHIIVYRDGVSESQYQEVLDKELPQIQAAVKQHYHDRQLPKITLLIVGKRHHTRFYPWDANCADKNRNVLAGTVVDRYCTMERNFDFFMVSHAGIQGTSRPAHYVVLHDSNNFAANQLQSITNDLTYVYGRASRSVSIATPAYYADIVCERGRFYLYSVYNKALPGKYQQGQDWMYGVHPNLANTMFYI
ncbi:hypothetical protein PRK78_000074 [Emydomyces testavorans]|uniref:Piwi domain-containing protein n=1 Tax=Emydomyces testavorans TaxID=2070801 RepID=A0AAF0D9Z6_9EURO|nr:hypothetical protein PRK78_000074 [Emydomyces testavorans]